MHVTQATNKQKCNNQTKNAVEDDMYAEKPFNCCVSCVCWINCPELHWYFGNLERLLWHCGVGFDENLKNQVLLPIWDKFSNENTDKWIGNNKGNKWNGFEIRRQPRESKWSGAEKIRWENPGLGPIRAPSLTRQNFTFWIIYPFSCELIGISSFYHQLIHKLIWP